MKLASNEASYLPCISPAPSATAQPPQPPPQHPGFSKGFSFAWKTLAKKFRDSFWCCSSSVHSGMGLEGCFAGVYTQTGWPRSGDLLGDSPKAPLLSPSIIKAILASS